MQLLTVMGLEGSMPAEHKFGPLHECGTIAKHGSNKDLKSDTKVDHMKANDISLMEEGVTGER
jgi:hypothetical protein